MCQLIQAVDFEYNTDVVSKRQYEEHIKLYKGYVTKINEITKDLKTDPDEKDTNATYSKYRGLKESETYALDGILLHELYFQGMDRKETVCGKRMQEMFHSVFGGYDCWAEDFKACAKSARGWCVFAYEQRTGTYRNFLLDTHNLGVVCMAYPLIALDMYEHAYFMDYGTKKDAYIESFMKAINWNVIEKRFNKVVAIL